MYFGPVRIDLIYLAEGVLALLDALSIVFALVIAYLVFTGNALRNDERRWSSSAVAAVAAGFLAICGGTLAAAHAFLQASLLLPAILTMVVGSAVAVAFYFGLVKRQLRPADNRIPHTMMVWSALALLSIGALAFILIGQDRFRFETAGILTTDSAVKLAGIVISAAGIVFTYVMKSDASIRTARQQIYQTLELQSIELFRFEGSHKKLVRGVWSPEQDKEDASESGPDAAFDHLLRQYICQMLNLFEMAYRFRVEHVMPPDVFGSWVIWMWELSGSKVFQKYWTDESRLPLNYVKDFRAVMQCAVDIRQEQGKTDVEGRNEFFDILAKNLGCKEIRFWFSDNPPLRGLYSSGTTQ